MDKDKQIAELSAWGEKMRTLIVARQKSRPCGNPNCACELCEALALTPPQAYKDWASRMGRLEEIVDAYTSGDEICNSYARSGYKPGGGARCGVCAECLVKALSDQEIKR